MKKSELVRKLGTNRAIAELLGISVQAVAKWPVNRNIPLEREAQLRKARPDLFGGAK